MLLVILDIDNTLVHTLPNKFIIEEWKNDFNTYCYDDQTIFLRPHLIKFLDDVFKLDNVKFGVFTAGSESYANTICNFLFKDKKLEFLLSRFDYIDCYQKTNKFKDINYVLNRYPEFKDYKVVIIDDHPFVKQSNPDDCYFIPAFSVLNDPKIELYLDIKKNLNELYNKEAKNDNELIQLIDFVKFV